MWLEVDISILTGRKMCGTLTCRWFMVVVKKERKGERETSTTFPDLHFCMFGKWKLMGERGSGVWVLVPHLYLHFSGPQMVRIHFFFLPLDQSLRERLF